MTMRILRFLAIITKNILIGVTAPIWLPVGVIFLGLAYVVQALVVIWDSTE